MSTLEHKKRNQLRDTFIVFFVIISCVPILALGTISLISSVDIHKKNVSDLEAQTLTTASEITSSFFDDIINTLSTNFDTLDQNNLQSTKVAWQQTYTEKFINDNKALLEVSFVNLQGKEIAKSSKISTSTSFLYFSELPLFKKALLGEIVISDVQTTLQGQIVTIVVPSILNGKVMNVVIADVSLSPLITSLEKIRLGKGQTGYVLLFDKQGTLIGSKNTKNNVHLNFTSWDRFTQVLQGKSFDALDEEDRYTSPVSTVPVIGSAKQNKDTGWAIFVEWPTIEADIITQNLKNSTLIVILLSIIIVVIIASFFANFLVRPIKLLQEQAEQIERGNFDNQISITTNNELEDLGDSFNAMTTGLKRLEELKNEFVYIAAHELRAPVTAIKGYMELIFDGSAGALTPEMEHLLSPVKKSNDRLVNLVNDLLKVARSEAGKLEIILSPSDISKEISAILEEVKPLALKRNITLHYQTIPNLPLVNINTGSFKEILMNFVSNAIKYGNDNGTVTITHQITDGSVATSIIDDGRGISDDDQKHLFEKFFRADEVKKTTIEGTGLGLFITKELVEKMNGTLSVSSALGKGTSFTITFKQT